MESTHHTTLAVNTVSKVEKMSERKGTKALELWCKRLVKNCPNVQIENMTTSWRNGLAFCALVHHFRPDLIDVSSLNPENIYENNQLAFSVAEKHLGIPALLDPEDMVENEIPDRLSILTYLSQFYQHLGHTVNAKASDHESRLSPPSSTQSTAPFMFCKAGLDKCAACDLPVYLAQRLIVSHKLYHRRCFRCSKCCGHLNPNNFEMIDGSDFSCDSCKNEKTASKFLNNNDQMGMLAFTVGLNESKTKPQDEEKPISPKLRSKPLSILERINQFENDIEKESIENKLSIKNFKDIIHNKHKDLKTSSFLSSTSGLLSNPSSVETDSKDVSADILVSEKESPVEKTDPVKSYKINVNKHSFLQTQLSDEGLKIERKIVDDDDADVVSKESQKILVYDVGDTTDQNNTVNSKSSATDQEDNNITDDLRLAKAHSESPKLDTFPLEESDLSKNKELSVSVPPRRKKNKSPKLFQKKENHTDVQQCYPDELNPFSADEDETEQITKNLEAPSKKVSTNPFGSSDEEDDDVSPIPALSKTVITTSTKRHITALNPFWSDSDEISSEDESNNSSSMTNTSLATSTPNLPDAAAAARRRKGRAPPPPPARSAEPPPAVTVEPPAPSLDRPCTSMDDVASISSYSSYNSTVHSDQKSLGKITPRFKKRPAPTPPDSVSTSSVSGSMERGLDSTMRSNISDQSGRKVKGPAPGLPLPGRRRVKLQMSAEELQVQMDLLETQQLGLERQGVLIEKMIRDKCEGDKECTAPPEEVEDLVIQLCELVNEKNDLFRKQTELMYIRRQQRLEQEQADIEHEIRVIQSRPAVNRIDADKAREEQLVARLVRVVLLRDELVQRVDAERRRERREDLAIAASIASRRAQRNSGSNSSSMKSVEVTPIQKKNKIKDKVKKQLKKAKHSLISKKKDESGECKEMKTANEK